MRRSLNDGSGFLTIDHTDSPGVDANQLPAGFTTAGKGELLERDVQQCSHCQRSVVLNPDRVRKRAVCHKCYHYICDGCEEMRAATGDCVPFKQVFDKAADLAIKYADEPSHPDATSELVKLTEFIL